MTKWLSGSVVVILILWLGTCWYISEQFLGLGIVDYNEEEELEILEELNIDDLSRQQVEIQSADVLLSASWFLQPDKNECAVVLLPGIGGYRTQVLPALPIFWELDCHVLTYDPRGTGKSTRVDRTFGYLEKKDNANVILWIEQQTGIKQSRIGVWGPSFGGAVGLLTLDELDELGFVIADSTFYSLQQVAHDTIKLLSSEVVASIFSPMVLFILEMRTGMNVDEVIPADSIVNTKTPVLLIHALHDPAMNVSHSQQVFDARTSEKVEIEILDWAGAGHADSAIVNPNAYRKLVHRFLLKHDFARDD